MYLALIFSSLVSAVEVSFASFEPQYLGEFTKGFFSGVTNGNMECSQAASQTANALYNLVDDVKEYSGSYVQVLADLNALNLKLTEIDSDCDVNGLIMQVHKVLGPSGKAIVMKNYFMNLNKITQDFADIQSCSNDYFGCGVKAGEVFRLLTGYNLKEKSLELQAPTGKDLLDLFEGFVSSASWAATEDCNEMALTFKSIKSVRSDILNAINSPVTEYAKILQVVLGVWLQDTDVVDCAMQFGGMALYMMPTILSSKTSWNLAWKSEGDTLSRLFTQLATECPQNYHKCGQNAANIFNIVAAFSDDL